MVVAWKLKLILNPSATLLSQLFLKGIGELRD
jgi:hypothetical protein